ncbi:hypothetical protein [Botryobacter ruber]|nr:hypothetical protein [Botryobacter ruber]
MPNHFHFLIWVRAVEVLEQLAKVKNPVGFENIVVRNLPYIL